MWSLELDVENASVRQRRALTTPTDGLPGLFSKLAFPEPKNAELSLQGRVQAT
jgi:hypothetical protein